MKHISLIIAGILIFANLTFSQWTVLNPHPTPNTTYVGSAPSADRYYTVTGQGEAVFTHDGGTNWNVVQIGGNGIYRSTFFINDNTGWAVGSFQERLHKTTDGGFTWTHQPNAPDTTKYDVFFLDDNIGWAVGFNGFIIKTTDGGSSWFSQSNTSISSQTLYAVWATDVNHVFVVGNNDALLRSTDGGDTWNLASPVFGSVTDYRDIYFPPTATGLIGYVVGERNRIAKTTDAGVTWSPLLDGGGTTLLWSLTFDSSNMIGLASGASSTLWKTSDGGTNWVPVTGITSESITFYSVRFGADNAVYLSGRNGYFYKSTDGGVTWNKLGYRFTTLRIKDINFADNTTGYIVGPNGLIAKTTDGGYTFTTQNSPTSLELSELVAVSPDVAFACGDDAVVVRTTDGGVTWDLISTGLSTSIDLLAIDFVSETTGWIAGTSGVIAKTTDGGNTWIDQSLSVSTLMWDMDFVDDQYGWIVGTGEDIYATTNGGNNWTLQFSGGGLGTYGISFIDRFTGVAGGTGGNTYYTSNGGMTWFSSSSPPDRTVWGIHMVDSPVYGPFAMTACASGYVFISTDGGITWTEQPRFTISTMDDVYLTDAANAWFVGNSGLILNYYEPDNIPVELASFTAEVNQNNVTLSWTTATETNNLEFTIQRALSSITQLQQNWTIVGFVEGSGTTTEPQLYSFVDKNLAAGVFSYRIKQTDLDGSFKFYDLQEKVEIGIPDKFELLQNYPNPFNPSTKINFIIPSVIASGTKQSLVTLKVYDILGKEVATLVNELKPAGSYEIDFSAESAAGGLSSGVYYYRLKAGDFTSVKKMLFMK